MDDDQELMDAFYEETQSLIDEMRKDLSALGEEYIPTILHNLFRCAHTLKGSSGIVGFDNLREVAQALEKIFKAAKDQKCEINDDVISLLSESIEACHRLLDGDEVEGLGELLKKLNRIPDHLD